MRPQGFPKRIERGQIEPVYFFHGEEKFLMEQALSALKRAVLTQGFEDFNYHPLDGQTAKVPDLLTLCQTLPLFSERRLVVVRDVELLTESEGMIPYLERPCRSTCLVLIARKVDQRKRLFSALKGRAEEVSFPSPAEAEVLAWVQKFSRSAGIRLTPEAAVFLKDRVDGDLFALQKEIEKLSLLFSGDQALGASEIETCLTGAGNFSAFEWLDAAQKGNLEAALRHLHGLLEGGEAPLALLGLLLSRLRRAARSPGQSRFYGRSQKSGEWADLWAYGLWADSRLKSSGPAARLVLEMLTFRLCAKNEGRLGEKELLGILSGPGGGFSPGL